MRKVIVDGTEYSLRYDLAVRNKVEGLTKQADFPGMFGAMASGNLSCFAAVLLGGIQNNLNRGTKGLEVEDVIGMLSKHCAGGNELIDLQREVYSEVFETGILGKKIDPERVLKVWGLAREEEAEEGAKPADEGGVVDPQ